MAVLIIGSDVNFVTSRLIKWHILCSTSENSVRDFKMEVFKDAHWMIFQVNFFPSPLLQISSD